MKTKAIVLGVSLFVVAALCFAAHDAFMGTWKLNEAKSKFPAGAGKLTTVVYEMAGNDIKVTVDGVDKDGKATHNEWTGKFDGKSYPVTGDMSADARSYKMVNDHTLDFTVKKDGKTTVTGKIVIAHDGKSRTVNSTSTDADGKKVNTVAVYDKE